MPHDDLAALAATLARADASIDSFESVKWACIFTILAAFLVVRVGLPLFALARSYLQWRKMKRPRLGDNHAS